MPRQADFRLSGSNRFPPLPLNWTPAPVLLGTISLVSRSFAHKPFDIIGITYDTGGLAVKPRDGMCGMKTDMGGSAAVLGAFVAGIPPTPHQPPPPCFFETYIQHFSYPC